VRVIFKKAVKTKFLKAVVGTICDLNGKFLKEQIALGNVDEYRGAWPPRIRHSSKTQKGNGKMKLKLKELK
jgi:hypothetical protein